MHAMISSVHGMKETRCGLTVKAHEATGWESEVTCKKCGIKKSLGLQEPPRPDKVSGKVRHMTQPKEKQLMARATTLELDSDLVEQIVQLRDQEEKKWSEIAQITETAAGKCMLLYASAHVPKKELIKNATAADVVRLRDKEVLSWGQISVRCQL